MKFGNNTSRLKPAYLFSLGVPLLLWLALKDIQWTAVGAAIARLNGWQLAALGGLSLVTLLSFSGRWWVILRAQGYSIPYWVLTGYRTASFGVSYFTLGPQFGGEPLQVYLLARKHAVPGPVAAAATALDKVLELLVNFVFLALGGLVMGEGQLTGGLLLTFVALVGLLVGFLAAAWLGWMPLSWALGGLPAGWTKRGWVQNLVQGVAESERQVSKFCREQPASLVAALMVSALSWGFILAEYWLGLHFLGLNLDLRQLMVAVTLNHLSFLAPLPGGLGALEASQVLAMTVLGLDPALGVSQGVIIRARDVAVGLAGLGIGWLAGRPLSPKRNGR